MSTSGIRIIKEYEVKAEVPCEGCVKLRREIKSYQARITELTTLLKECLNTTDLPNEGWKWMLEPDAML